MPLVMIALQEELRMPLQRDEGPIGLIICPSRELAGQTAEVLASYCQALTAVRESVRRGGRDQRSLARPHTPCVIITHAPLRPTHTQRTPNPYQPTPPTTPQLPTTYLQPPPDYRAATPSCARCSASAASTCARRERS